MISTPKGLNMFYHFWKGAQSKQNEYIPIEVTWNQVPKYPGGPLRDEEWKQETIRNSSERQFQEEFICDFMKKHNLSHIDEGYNKNTKIKLINHDVALKDIKIGETLSTKGIVYGIVELNSSINLGNKEPLYN